EGDRVRIYRRGGTKTLKKLYNEYGIPLNEREQLPVLCDDAGIVWIARIGVAERCAVSEETNKVFKVSFKTFEGEV
ncbi:MAG: tRNA lysidine(34) synthetase TilS, partial [Clostridia bacterium]|nr:tRNA lysidine(34) synthetase TilS [Clostridia bacterium]